MRCQVKPASSPVWQKLFDDFRILRVQDSRTPLVAYLLVGALDHAVAFARLIGSDFACGRQAKALFSTALGFQFGHLLLSFFERLNFKSFIGQNCWPRSFMNRHGMPFKN